MRMLVHTRVRACDGAHVRVCVCESACACACGPACGLLRVRARVRARVLACACMRVRMCACGCVCAWGERMRGAHAYACEFASPRVCMCVRERLHVRVGACVRALAGSGTRSVASTWGRAYVRADARTCGGACEGANVPVCA